MINKNQKQVSEDSSESTIMKFANISKTYSDGFEALRDVSFTIPKKGIFGILGPNGAGKSTLFNIATLQLRRSDGDILIENNGSLEDLKEKIEKIIKDIERGKI